MTDQIPGLFALSPSTKRRIDTPSRRAKRPSVSDTPLQVAGAQKARAELEAAQGDERIMCATAAGASWTLVDEAGVVLDSGTSGRDFGAHHTLMLAIGQAVKRVAPVLPEQPAVHLIVRVNDRTFGYVNRVGTSTDDGKGGKVRGLALRSMNARVLLTVERVDGTPNATQPAPAPEVRTPPVVSVTKPDPERYVDHLIQALRACAAHLSIDAVTRYQITGRVGQAERELIHSLAREPAMADVQDGLYDHPDSTVDDVNATVDAVAESWRASRGGSPF